jgi:hypothetical protein
MESRLISMLPAVALALVSGAALAQYFYKSTMPDGKVIYGDVPTPGAVKVEKTRPDTSKQGISGATPKETETLRRMESERPNVGGSNQRAADIEAALKKMEAEREKAREPLEGERIGRSAAAGASPTATGNARGSTKPAWNRCAMSSRGLAWNSAPPVRAAAERET